MDAKDIKVCPKCGMAVAGNIMRCLSCRTYIPDDPKLQKDEEE